MMKRIDTRRMASALLIVAFAVCLATALSGDTNTETQGTLAGDALTPELRSRVERLKVEAPVVSTDREELRRRLDTLWEWSTAAFRGGATMGPDFPSIWGVCYRSVRGTARGAVAPERISDFIARSVRELAIKDDSPHAVGPLALAPEGPFIAGDFETVTLTYTVGEMPMRAGGGVVLARSWGVSPQTTDPAADSYVTVRCSRPDSRLEAAEPWGTWRTYLFSREIAFRLSGAPLTSGDTVTITVGDRSGGSRGMPVQAWSNDRVVLRFGVDLEGEGVLLTPRWPSFEVVGRPETRYVNCIAPSVVAAGEPFRLAVRSEDRFKNPIGGRAPEYRLMLDGEPFRTVSAAAGPVTVLDDIRIAEPGVYRFSASSSDGSVTGTGNPVWVRRRPAQRLWWGETHGHVGLADGQGSPEGYYRYGRDIARLDFLTLSEHDTWTDDSEWQMLQGMARRFLDTGTFTPILGYEWTADAAVGGHHNVYFRTAAGRERVSHQRTLNLEELYAGLRKIHRPEDVLVIPHAHNPGDWRSSDAAVERLVELTSGHGTFEWFGNRYLQNGFHVGFIGSSDNHRLHPGYGPATNFQMGGLAAVFAAENTPEALFESLRARTCYATTGERIIVDADLDGVAMGQRVTPSARRRIRCRVMGTAPIETVDLIKNGDVVYSHSYLRREIGGRTRVQLYYFSSSEGILGPDGPETPRFIRGWTAAVEVRGATLVGLREPWFTAPGNSAAGYTSYPGGPDRFERDPANPNRVLVGGGTRGRGKGLLLELDGASRDTEIVVRVEEAAAPRTSSGPVQRRTLPGGETSFRLDDLTAEPATWDLSDGEYRDGIRLQLVPPGAALDQEFTYTDVGGVEPGDYYYLRVRQVDGAVAWSSPWWVAGTP
jgi:hypothetical protein